MFRVPRQAGGGPEMGSSRSSFQGVPFTDDAHAMNTSRQDSPFPLGRPSPSPVACGQRRQPHLFAAVGKDSHIRTDRPPGVAAEGDLDGLEIREKSSA